MILSSGKNPIDRHCFEFTYQHRHTISSLDLAALNLPDSAELLPRRHQQRAMTPRRTTARALLKTISVVAIHALHFVFTLLVGVHLGISLAHRRPPSWILLATCLGIQLALAAYHATFVLRTAEKSDRQLMWR